MTIIVKYLLTRQTMTKIFNMENQGKSKKQLRGNYISCFISLVGIAISLILIWFFK